MQLNPRHNRHPLPRKLGYPLDHALSYLNCNTLNINGTEIVRSDRCLHDVEADASILTYGTLDVERMPAAGWSGDVEAAKVGGGTRTLHFNHGVFTGYTDT